LERNFGQGPSEWFTGTVRIIAFSGTGSGAGSSASVTFEPGRDGMAYASARQTLIVTAGCGRVQRWGGPIEEIRPGDVVWFSPDEKHGTALRRRRHDAHRHSGKKGRKVVDWMEHVSDEQYRPEMKMWASALESFARWTDEGRCLYVSLLDTGDEFVQARSASTLL